jgi:hypothetical protein
LPSSPSLFTGVTKVNREKVRALPVQRLSSTLLLRTGANYCLRKRSSMNAEPADCERNAFLESLAAELTDAAYQVALRHGVRDKWLDLQLDLWRAMTQALATRFCSHAGESRRMQDGSTLLL